MVKLECADCARKVDKDDVIFVDRVPVCRRCFNKYYLKCSYCGNYCDRRVSVKFRIGYVCDNCLKSGFFCVSCGEITDPEDLDEKEMCEECREESEKNKKRGFCVDKNREVVSFEKSLEKIPNTTSDGKKIDHGVLSVYKGEKTSSLLRNVFMKEDDEMFPLIADYIKNLRSPYKESEIFIEEPNFMIVKGTIPVMITAHVDTTSDKPSEIYITEKTGIIVADPRSSICGDDRAGVFAVLSIVDLGYRPWLFFSKGEEKGLKGAREFVKIIGWKEAPDLKYIISFDRHGKDDCVFYDDQNEDFVKYVESFGFKKAFGTASDIRVICPEWGVSGVNLSSGFYQEHSNDDFVVLPFLYNTIERAAKMLDNIPVQEFVFTATKKIDNKWLEMYD